MEAETDLIHSGHIGNKGRNKNPVLKNEVISLYDPLSLIPAAGVGIGSGSFSESR
jgi:hypothetical protein